LLSHLGLELDPPLAYKALDPKSLSIEVVEAGDVKEVLALAATSPATLLARLAITLKVVRVG